MSQHESAHEGSRLICEAIVSQMGERISGLRRKEATNVCSFGATGGSNFFYVYHRKSKASVRIYFVGDPDVEPPLLPGGLSLRVRPRFKSSWERRFPYYFDLDDITYVAEVVSFLATLLTKPDPNRVDTLTDREERIASVVEKDLLAQASENEYFEGRRKHLFFQNPWTRDIVRSSSAPPLSC